VTRAVVLVGPPGAGKSSVGSLLAAELDVPFADTDDLVAAAAGKPVGDIFVDDGEPVFREFERLAVARGLETVGRGVLALGSGAVLDPDVRRMLDGQLVVYLEAGFATIARRARLDDAELAQFNQLRDQALSSADFQEGQAAFAAKRRPRFTGG